MNYQSNSLAERFIATIGRAFFTDTTVIVLDALIREKYIREEELGPRLRMAQKTAREAIAHLTDGEMIVKCEEVNLTTILEHIGTGNKHVAKFYYIDYQSFINIVRYRINCMLKAVQSQENKQNEDIYFECPTCKHRYTSLEASKLLSADFKFICPACCPDFNISRTMSQPSFRLKEIDNSKTVSAIRKLEIKLKDQLTRSIDHDGILEMLEDLKDVPLSRNKPSDNMKRGIRSSEVRNNEVADEIKDIIVAKNSIKDDVDIKVRHFNLLSTRLDGTEKVKAQADTDETTVDNSESLEIQARKREAELVAINEVKRARQSEIVGFLQESGVKGSQKILQQVQSLHVQRGMVAGESSGNLAVSNDYDNITRESVVINTFTGQGIDIAKEEKKNNAAEDEDDEEDIAWEEEEE